MDLARVIEGLALRDTHWSLDLRAVESGERIFEHDSHRLLRTASVAKVYLLIEVASMIASGELDPGWPLDRRAVEPVADSGLWQHLSADTLRLIDVARLVGAMSDNLGTNVLLDLVGLEAVQARARSLAGDGSTLNDYVRDSRLPSDPQALSEGSAADWASLFVQLKNGLIGSVEESALVMDWLAPGADLSMVASAYGLDPLSHAHAVDRGVAVWNKTGTDIGVRADVGVVGLGSGSVAYAVICNWDPQIRPDPRDEVLRTMRRIGEWLPELSRSRREFGAWASR